VAGQLVIFVGLQAAGKSSFFRERFASTHAHVSKDLMPRAARDKQAQQIAQLGDPEQVPLDIALLIDVSASVEARFGFEQKAAADFLRQVLKPGDRATVFAIDQTPRLIQPFANAEVAARQLMTLTAAKGYTAFFDSVLAAEKYLDQNSSQGRRRVIVVLSDGDDTARIAELYNRGNSQFSDVQNQVRFIERAQADVLREVQRAELLPLGHDYRRVGVFGTGIRIRRVRNIGKKLASLVHASRIVSANERRSPRITIDVREALSILDPVHVARPLPASQNHACLSRLVHVGKALFFLRASDNRKTNDERDKIGSQVFFHSQLLAEDQVWGTPKSAVRRCVCCEGRLFAPGTSDSRPHREMCK